ncbi:alpha-L-fucosidase [Streptomyces shenzhenensis]|uniref:alpha-L-fucosidase n=1 Tax=Streptomyces shenzhenensis TaxID=943815 RepID=UPI003807CF51
MSELEPARREATLAWARRNRLGMFIHWGLYSLAARHEWVKNRERMTDEQYDRYVRHFDPDLYDPAAWARAARAAGMSYAVLTTKHHDGFCLWPSELTDYTVAHTPYGKDIVGPYADAFRAEGLGVGLYFSLLDWHHPDFAVDGFHPRRGDAEAIAHNARRDPERYRRFLHGQVREVLTRFGPLEIGFLDFSYPDGYPTDEGPVWGGKGAEDWGSKELYRTVRELQPDMVLNDRLDFTGDFVTPEQYQPSRPMTLGGEPVPWIACQTINGSWGYDRDNTNDKSPDLVVRMLIDTVSKDGSLLLNVGPDGRGRLDPTATRTLHEVGQWMALHRRSIDGAGASVHQAPPDCRYTQVDNRLYVHVFAWPFRHLHLPGLAGKVTYAQFLHDASEICYEVLAPGQEANILVPAGEAPGTLTLQLPERRPDVAVPVIELFLAEGERAA